MKVSTNLIKFTTKIHDEGSKTIIAEDVSGLNDLILINRNGNITYSETRNSKNELVSTTSKKYNEFNKEIFRRDISESDNTIKEYYTEYDENNDVSEIKFTIYYFDNSKEMSNEINKNVVKDKKLNIFKRIFKSKGE